MGLLRRAATAASRDTADELIPAPDLPEAEKESSPGLLRRSARVRGAADAESAGSITQALSPAGPAPIPAAAAPTDIHTGLSVELVPEAEQILETDTHAVAVDMDAIPELEMVTEDETIPEPVSSPEAALVEEMPPQATIEEHEEEHIPTALPPRRPDPEQTIAGILQDIASLADGVELPSRLFSRLAAGLGITKGAFLLYDALRLVYAPWASIGYDQTTLHRMRIPLGANASFNALANGLPLSLDDPHDREGYQHYFSSREFSGLSRLIMAPFIAEGTLIAVLIVTELSSPFAGDEELLTCLTRVMAAGSPRVHAARTEKLSATGAGAAAGAGTPADEMSRFVTAVSAPNGATLLMTISVEEYAAAVIKAHEHLDPFRLQEDIAYFMSSFLADTGKVMTVRKGVFIAALSGVDPSDADLFIHQLSRFLRGLFGAGTGDAPGPRILKVQPWPSDGGDIRNVIESLSS